MIAEKQGSKTGAQLRAFVGRVGKNQVIGFSRARALQKFEDILFPNRAVKMSLGQIALDCRNRAAVPFDKCAAGGAATERLNPEGASAGKEIEHACSEHAFSQAGEDGSLDPVHRRANFGFGNKKADAAGASGDDSHGDGETVGEAVSASVSSGETGERSVCSAGEGEGEVGAGVSAGEPSAPGGGGVDPPGLDSLGEGAGVATVAGSSFFFFLE